MNSLNQLTDYLVEYGYYAIFLLVFLQQIGVPNPITNELVLVFCGYLSYSGTLNVYKAILAAVTADIAGSMLLFFVFYSFTKWLTEHSPKWLPLNGARMERIKKNVLGGGQRSIFFGRMTPIIRGYTSVVAGMLNINRKAFMGTVTLTAILWNGGLVLLGLLIGPYWGEVIGKTGMVQKIILLLVLVVVIVFISRYFSRRQLKEEK